MSSHLGEIKGLYLAHLNTRSMFNEETMTDIRLLLSDYILPVLTISETWLQEDVTDASVHIHGYQFYRQDRILGHKEDGGGNGAYIRDDMQTDQESLSHLNKNTPDIEMQWLVAHRPQAKIMAICTCYRPPDGDAENFLIKLNEAITSLIQAHPHWEIYCLGDMNLYITLDS